MRKSLIELKNPRTPTETETPSKKLRLFSVKEMFPDEIMTLRGYTMMLDNGRLSCCCLTDMLIQVKQKKYEPNKSVPALIISHLGLLRSFNSALKDWNSLPVEMRCLPYNAFKISLLKTFNSQ